MNEWILPWSFHLYLFLLHFSSCYCAATPKGIGENDNAPYFYWVLRYQFFGWDGAGFPWVAGTYPKVHNNSISNSVTEAIKRAVGNTFKITIIGHPRLRTTAITIKWELTECWKEVRVLICITNRGILHHLWNIKMYTSFSWRSRKRSLLQQLLWPVGATVYQ